MDGGLQTTGTTLLGSTMFCSGLLMFLIGPYLGTLIDRYSRKKILLAENIVGFLVLFLLTIWGKVCYYWVCLELCVLYALYYRNQLSGLLRDSGRY